MPGPPASFEALLDREMRHPSLVVDDPTASIAAGATSPRDPASGHQALVATSGASPGQAPGSSAGGASSPSPGLGAGSPSDPSSSVPPTRSGRSSTDDFWDRYDQAAAAADLFAVPPAAVTAVIGDLEAALPVARRCCEEHWVGECEVFVLTERPHVPGEPTWRVVERPSDLVAVLEGGSVDFPLLVLDIPRELPAFVRPLVERLRQGGVGLVHYVLDGDPSDEDLATWLGELGRPSVLDLAAPVSTRRVLELLDRGEPVASVAGMAITTELLLALRLADPKAALSRRTR